LNFFFFNLYYDINIFLVDNPCNIFGQKMKQQCEDRLKYFETGEKPPKNVDVMHDALQESLVLQQQVFCILKT